MTRIIVPVIAVALMDFYEVCDTACSSLRGTFLGIDLKIVGIIFMVALLSMVPLARSAFARPEEHLRTLILGGAVGGEVLLVRFQIVNETYCPFCLAFGLCNFVLFAVNLPRMNKYLALGFFPGIDTAAVRINAASYKRGQICICPPLLGRYFKQKSYPAASGGEFDPER